MHCVVGGTCVPCATKCLFRWDNRGCESVSIVRLKGTCRVKIVAKNRGGVVLGRDDPSVTGRAGVVLVAEVERVLGVSGVFDSGVAEIRGKGSGYSAGGLLLATAEAMLCGADFMADLDDVRADVAAARLRAVPTPSACWFAVLARRFDDDRITQVEVAMGALVARWWDTLSPSRRAEIAAGRVTIDLDTTDVEVYGQKKRGVAYNYLGQLVGRVHAGTWAEAGVVLAGQLGSGADDPRPQAAGVLARALAALPEGLARPVVRADAGYHDVKVAQAAVALGCDYAVAVKRNQAVWAAELRIPPDAWQPAIGMTGAEVAVWDYTPAGWPAGTRCVARRVPIRGAMPTKRSRRRRTIPGRQLLLGLLGLGPAWAYSFILTNLADPAEEIETRFRERARIEERFKDAKLGMPLRHLPSGYEETNRVWMWSALLALNLSVFTQSLARVDNHPGHAEQRQRAHGKRLRRELICIPARIITHARATIIRPAPTIRFGPFPTALANLQTLPTWKPG